MDGAVHRAAGPGLAEAFEAGLRRASPAKPWPRPRSGLAPPVHYVIHTVGPVWDGGAYGEADVLEPCYRACLRVADELRARSVAFPAIATGLYRFPPEQAAATAVATVLGTRTGVELVRLVAFDEATYELYQANVESLPGAWRQAVLT